MSRSPHFEGGAPTHADMRARIRGHDWAATALGSIDQWPQRLRAAVDLMLDSAQPAYIAWGPELLSLYNDLYLPFVDGRHPESLGRPCRDVWPQLWDGFQAVADTALGGKPQLFVDHPITLAGRAGTPTRWFTLGCTPLRDDEGAVAGFLCTAIETTDRVLAERATQQNYRTLFESIDEAFCVIEMVFDAQDRPVDYIVLETNPAFVQHTGLVDAVGKHMRDLAPEHEAFWYETYGRIACTGRSERFEHRADALGRWYNVHAFRAGEPGQRRVAVIFEDITAHKQAALALQQRESLYRSLFDSIDEGFCIIEVVPDGDGGVADLIYREVNDAFEQHTGLANAKDQRVVALLPNLEPHWFEIYARVWKSGVPERVENHLSDVGRWYRAHYFRVGDKDDNRIGVVFEDITRDKQAEQVLRAAQEQQAFLLALSDALRPLHDPEAIRHAAASVLGRHLGANRVAYAEDCGDDDTFVVHRNYVDNARELSGRFRYADHGDDLLPVLRAGAHVVQPDVQHDARLDDAQRQMLRDAGIGASLNVPLVKGDRLVAFIGVNYNAAHVFSPAEIDLVARVAERTWSAVEHARVAAAVRESEARLAAAFESVPAGIAAIDLDGQTIVANAEYHRYIPTEVIPSRDPLRAGRWRGWNAEGHPLAPAEYPGARALRGESVVPGQEMLYLGDEGSTIWTNVATAPTRDTAGQVNGAVVVISDISERRQTLDALRLSEERLRQFGDATQDVLWIRDAETLQWQYLTLAFEHIYGLRREQALLGDNYRSWLDLIVPEDQPHVRAMIERVRAGEQVSFEYRIKRPADDGIRWVRNTDFPILDASGKVTMIGGIGHDLTELREAELRLKAVIEGIPQLVWRAESPGVWSWASPQWTRFTGQREEESIGWGWLAPLHPDDRERARDAWAGAVQRDGLEVEYRVLGASSGTYRWFQTRAVAVRDKSGEIVEWLGTSTDVDDMRQLQNRQAVLVAELQHRTFNLLAVVRAMADATLRSSGSLDEFKGKFRDRISALGRVQRLLSRLEEQDRVTFDELIRGELEATGVDDDGRRVTLDGPRGVALRSSSVQALAMALHELTTNAVKYGALRHAGARLQARWHVEDEEGRPWLHLDWRESGVSLDGKPDASHGTGQGRVLIEQALPYQLGARTTYAMTEDGVHCTIALPVSTHVPEAHDVDA